jgi:O-antigen/teichoic acid export membrane protein
VRDKLLNNVQRIVKNFFSLSFAQGVSKLLSFILVVYVARCLGEAGLGKYSFALGFAGLFMVFTDFGLSRLTIREVAREKLLTGRYLGNISVVKAILSLATFGLIILVINLLNRSPDTLLIVYLIALSLILNSFARLFQAIFNAFEKMEYEMITAVVERIIAVGLGVAVLIAGYGLIELSLVILVAAVVNVLLGFIIAATKFGQPEFSINWEFLKAAIREALPFGLTALFVTIYFQIDTVMLFLMKGDAATGWYNAAYKLIFALMFIPLAFVNSIFPVISKFYVSASNSLKIAYEKAFKYLVIIGLPIALAVTVMADKIIFIIYGKKFGNSVIALQILIWVMMLMFLTYLLGNVLESINRQGIVAKVTGLNALLNISLNSLLIPKFSYVGASVATVLTEAVGFGFLLNFIYRHLHALPLFKIIFRPLIASVVMGFFLFYFKQVNLLILIMLAVLLYFGMIYIFKVISEEDIGLVKQVLAGSLTPNNK